MGIRSKARKSSSLTSPGRLLFGKVSKGKKKLTIIVSFGVLDIGVRFVLYYLHCRLLLKGI